jgi:hypothetical protein
MHEWLEWLEWKGREFKEYDVETDSEARRRLRGLTQPPSPYHHWSKTAKSFK